MTSAQKAQNDAFIKKFKKDNKILTQSKLPTPVDEFNKKLIRDDCLLTDGMHWKKFVDEFKYDPIKHLNAMHALLDMCERCCCAPWQLVNLAVSNFGQTKFDDATIFMLRDNMLSPEELAEEIDEDDVEDVTSEDFVDENDDDAEGNPDDKRPARSQEDYDYIAEIARTGGNAAQETVKTPRKPRRPLYQRRDTKRARTGPAEEEIVTAQEVINKNA